MKEKMGKDVKMLLMGLLSAGEGIHKAIIRKAPEITAWKKDDKITSRTAQVSLNGLASFRLPANTEAQMNLLKKLVPGREILFTAESVDTATGNRPLDTDSGAQVKNVAKFVNYRNVEILLIGKGAEIEVDMDDDLPNEEAEITIVEKESTGFGAKTEPKDELPSVHEGELVGQKEI